MSFINRLTRISKKSCPVPLFLFQKSHPWKKTSLPVSIMDAIYSTSTLAQMNATPYSSLSGTLSPKLLNALVDMKYEYMTPVQAKVFSELPSLQTDW